jgi:predicted RNase H-like HicB family nuclease
MSPGKKGTTAKKRKKAIDRPFEPRIWAQAQRIAAEYQVIVWHEDGRWYGHGLEMPDVYGDGPTVSQCVESTIQGLTAVTAHLLEEGERPPAPAREGMRTEQINVRLSSEEKLIFEAGARRRGFKGLSDFIRAAALEYAR